MSGVRIGVVVSVAMPMLVPAAVAVVVSAPMPVVMGVAFALVEPALEPAARLGYRRMVVDRAGPGPGVAVLLPVGAGARGSLRSVVMMEAVGAVFPVMAGSVCVVM